MSKVARMEMKISSSSWISLLRADSGVSFISTFPPGNSHLPGSEVLGPRRQARSLPFSLMIRAQTTSRGGVSIL